MRERKKRNAFRVLVGNIKEKDKLENLSVGETVILKRALKEQWNGGKWIHLARDRKKRRALLSTVIKPWFP
jgi:hypothetical protein